MTDNMTDNNLPSLDTNLESDMAAAETAAQLAHMKTQADLLNVKYAPNIGLETLAERVRAKKESMGVDTELDDFNNAADTEEAVEVDGKKIRVSADTEAQYAIFRAKQLVRISINCLNPAKNKLQSDLYTVFSSTLGRISQVIPYHAPNGHHVPRALADLLREKTYVAFRPVHDPSGEFGVDKEHFEVPEFSIQELPPLTAEEFQRIVIRQDRIAASAFDED